MVLKILNDIENNVFSTVITVDSFGTEQLSEDEEKEMIKDFPTKVAYRNLTFRKHIKMNGSVPEVTNDEVGDSVVDITLPTLSNKEILLDENFEAVYRIDLSKIPNSFVDDNVLTKKELVAQAFCLIFDEVIRAEVSRIMTDIRSKAPAFSGELLIDV